nr:tyrosine-type recombinase/integrase [Butyrivibrio sp.]
MKYGKILKDVGISHKKFHVLRHTFATNCVYNGMDAKALSEILGHSSVQITLNRYVHPSMEQKRNQLNALSSVYAGYCA